MNEPTPKNRNRKASTASTDSPFDKSNKIQRSPTRIQIKDIPDKQFPKPLQIKIEPEQEYEIGTTEQNIPILNLDSPITFETVPIPRPKNRKPNTLTMDTKTIDEINTRIVNMVPEFSGSDAENTTRDLKIFITRAEWLRNLIDEDNKPMFDQLIQHRLTKDAYTKTSNKNIEDFDSLKKTLQDIYAVTESLDEVQRKCFTCQQTNTESIRQYGHRILSLLEDYRSSFIDKYNDIPNEANLADQIAKTFKKGLLDATVRKEMITVRTNKIEELIKEAETIENLLLELSDHQPSPQQNSQNQFQQKSNYRNIKCGFCGKMGHNAEECLSRKFKMEKKPNLQNTLYNNPTNTQNKYCTYCKIPGHTIQECRRKSREASNPSNQQRYPTNNPNTTTMRTYTKSCSFCKINGHDDNECWRKQQPGNYNTQQKPETVIQNNSSTNNSYQQKPEFRNNWSTPKYSNQQTPPNNRSPRKFYNRPNTNNRFTAPPNMTNLESTLENMKINQISQESVPQNYQNDEVQPRNNQSEN